MTTFPYSDPALDAAETTFDWTTTPINSLAAGTRALSDTVIDNEVGTGNGRYPFAWLKIKLGSFTPTAGDRVLAWLIPGDGTDFEDVVTSADPSARFLILNAQLRAAATARTLWLPRLQIAPVHYKLLIKNSCATAAFASSANAVTFGRYTVETR